MAIISCWLQHASCFQQFYLWVQMWIPPLVYSGLPCSFSAIPFIRSIELPRSPGVPTLYLEGVWGSPEGNQTTIILALPQLLIVYLVIHLFRNNFYMFKGSLCRVCEGMVEPEKVYSSYTQFLREFPSFSLGYCFWPFLFTRDLEETESWEKCLRPRLWVVFFSAAQRNAWWGWWGCCTQRGS